MRRAIAALAVCALAGMARGHGSPYVVFACRVTDGDARPAHGLTAILDAIADGGGAAGRAEAPVLAGEAAIALRFAGDFSGRLRLRIVDAKRRPLALSAGTMQAEYRYAHRAGAGTDAAFAARVRGAEADPLRDGEAVLGGDGRVHAVAEAAPALRLAATAPADSAEAEEDARGNALDRGIDAEIRARLDAIRKRREGR